MGRMQHFSRGVSTCLLLILALPLFCLSADSEGHVGAAAKGPLRVGVPPASQEDFSSPERLFLQEIQEEHGNLRAIKNQSGYGASASVTALSDSRPKSFAAAAKQQTPQSPQAPKTAAGPTEKENTEATGLVHNLTKAQFKEDKKLLDASIQHLKFKEFFHRLKKLRHSAREARLKEDHTTFHSHGASRGGLVSLYPGGHANIKPENVEFMRMQVSDIKAHEYADKLKDYDAARNKCMQINVASQFSCSKVFCKEGLAHQHIKGCGDGGTFCDADTVVGGTPLFGLTPTSGDLFHQTSEKVSKAYHERKEKATHASWKNMLEKSDKANAKKTGKLETVITTITKEQLAEKSSKTHITGTLEKAVKLMDEKSVKFDEATKKQTVAELDTKSEKKKKTFAKKEKKCSEKSTKAKTTCVEDEKHEKEVAAKEKQEKEMKQKELLEKKMRELEDKAEIKKKEKALKEAEAKAIAAEKGKKAAAEAQVKIDHANLEKDDKEKAAKNAAEKEFKEKASKQLKILEKEQEMASKSKEKEENEALTKELLIKEEQAKVVPPPITDDVYFHHSPSPPVSSGTTPTPPAVFHFSAPGSPNPPTAAPTKPFTPQNPPSPKQIKTFLKDPKVKESLEKETVTKVTAQAEFKIKTKEKENKALPPGLPRGNFHWSLSKPCDAGSGQFYQFVKARTKVDVGTIPIGKTGVRVELKCKTDVDIELWDGKTNEAVIAFISGKINNPYKQCLVHRGDKICYSGYWGTKSDLSAMGDEWITVSPAPGRTSHPYVMKAYGFAAGKAKVTYSWEGLATKSCTNPSAPPILSSSKTLLKVLATAAMEQPASTPEPPTTKAPTRAPTYKTVQLHNTAGWYNPTTRRRRLTFSWSSPTAAPAYTRRRRFTFSTHLEGYSTPTSAPANTRRRRFSFSWNPTPTSAPETTRRRRFTWTAEPPTSESMAELVQISTHHTALATAQAHAKYQMRVAKAERESVPPAVTPRYSKQELMQAYKHRQAAAEQQQGDIDLLHPMKHHRGRRLLSPGNATSDAAFAAESPITPLMAPYTVIPTPTSAEVVGEQAPDGTILPQDSAHVLPVPAGGVKVDGNGIPIDPAASSKDELGSVSAADASHDFGFTMADIPSYSGEVVAPDANMTPQQIMDMPDAGFPESAGPAKLGKVLKDISALDSDNGPAVKLLPASGSLDQVVSAIKKKPLTPEQACDITAGIEGSTCHSTELKFILTDREMAVKSAKYALEDQIETEKMEKADAKSKHLDAESGHKVESAEKVDLLHTQLITASDKLTEEREEKKLKRDQLTAQETNRVTHEKDFKAKLPERGNKEKAQKRKPMCHSMLAKVVQQCRKVTDEGYHKCRILYDDVPMHKTIQRPWHRHQKGDEHQLNLTWTGVSHGQAVFEKKVKADKKKVKADKAAAKKAGVPYVSASPSPPAPLPVPMSSITGDAKGDSHDDDAHTHGSVVAVATGKVHHKPTPKVNNGFPAHDNAIGETVINSPREAVYFAKLEKKKKLKANDAISKLNAGSWVDDDSSDDSWVDEKSPDDAFEKESGYRVLSGIAGMSLGEESEEEEETYSEEGPSVFDLVAARIDTLTKSADGYNTASEARLGRIGTRLEKAVKAKKKTETRLEIRRKGKEDAITGLADMP